MRLAFIESLGDETRQTTEALTRTVCLSQWTLVFDCSSIMFLSYGTCQCGKRKTVEHIVLYSIRIVTARKAPIGVT
jgi:hypothetical protein